MRVSRMDIGVFHLTKHGALHLDSSYLAMLGYDAGAVGEDALTWLRGIIHHSDLEYALEDQRKLFGGSAELIRRELRLRKADGSYLAVRRTARRTDDGIVGFIENLEDLHSRASRHESLIANLPTGLVTYRLHPDESLELIEANATASEMVGVDFQQHLGAKMLDIFPEMAGTEYPEWFREVAKNGGRVERLQRIPRGIGLTGVYDSVVFQAMPDEATMVFNDVTTQVELQEKAERSESRLRSRLDELRELARELREETSESPRLEQLVMLLDGLLDQEP